MPDDIPSISNTSAGPRLTKTPPLTHIEVDIAYLKSCGPKNPMPWELRPGESYVEPAHRDEPPGEY